MTNYALFKLHIFGYECSSVCFLLYFLYFDRGYDNDISVNLCQHFTFYAQTLVSASKFSLIVLSYFGGKLYRRNKYLWFKGPTENMKDEHFYLNMIYGVFFKITIKQTGGCDDVRHLTYIILTVFLKSLVNGSLSTVRVFTKHTLKFIFFLLMNTHNYE